MKKLLLLLLGCYILLNSCSKKGTFENFTYPDGKHKALIMSYDDGVVDDIRLISLFEKNGIVGTFNLNSGYLGMTRGWATESGDTVYQSYIPADSLTAVYKNHEIAAHGTWHQDLFLITQPEVLKEIESDVSALNRITGRKITSMAYAFGNTNNEIAKTLSSTTITNARTVSDTHKFDLPDNYLIWNPTCHDSKANKYAADYISLNSKRLSVFYVWGHSWELKDKSRWNDMVTFCETIGNHDAIWYVRSGQFIAYLDALKKVKVQENEIVNPANNDTVWVKFSTESKPLAPGKKLNWAKPRANK